MREMTTTCDQHHIITYSVRWWQSLTKAQRRAREGCWRCAAHQVHSTAWARTEADPYTPVTPLGERAYYEPDVSWQAARGPIVEAMRSGGGGNFDGGGASGRWENDLPLHVYSASSANDPPPAPSPTYSPPAACPAPAYEVPAPSPSYSSSYSSSDSGSCSSDSSSSSSSSSSD